jgi:hypothetical protein
MFITYMAETEKLSWICKIGGIRVWTRIFEQEETERGQNYGKGFNYG